MQPSRSPPTRHSCDNFVKTSSAREKIRSWFKKERREENVQKGREQLDKEFRRLRQQALSSIKDDRLLELALLIRDHALGFELCVLRAPRLLRRHDVRVRLGLGR